MEKSIRVHTNTGSDTVLNVNIRQDFDFLEVLSLKLRQKDAYRLHSSNYGVIVGRVLANDAFGIPNAKVSLFIERDPNDDQRMAALYPYSTISTKDDDGRRYNIIPDSSDDDCYRVVGTFPNKRLILDDDIQLEVYDKYWKWTTTTNQAGDYMLFGVPSGVQQIHVELDISDIGILSQKPRDLIYQGYNLTLFETSSQFKKSTNLDGLAQLFSQNKSVDVKPFWGDEDDGIISISRSDVQIQYKFEPTCIFMGSIVSDNDGNAIGHKCDPSDTNGLNNQLVGGNGTIEMIRKTPDGLVEEFPIQGNQLIDENGVWCYQIPMNLDYVGTDEYGNIVPTDNPSKGIPTRTQVRFRFSKTETGDEGFSRHTAKYLVPMNPIFSEKHQIPTIPVAGSEIEKMYNFGSATPDHCFRDLYWNNVYSVKNFIPKSQTAHRATVDRYTGLKGANLADDQNPIPFNKLRFKLPFTFILICILVKIVMIILSTVNFMISVLNKILKTIDWAFGLLRGIPVGWIHPFSFLPKINCVPCIPLSPGVAGGDIGYFPGCTEDCGMEAAKCPDGLPTNCTKSSDGGAFMDAAQRSLALDFKIVKFDLYEDWINGVLYLPLWHWRKRKKKKFLFFTIAKAKSEYCSCDTVYNRIRSMLTCSIRYSDNKFTLSSDNSKGELKWHSKRTDAIGYKRGLIKPVENRDGLTIYYYNALNPRTTVKNPKQEMAKQPANFEAVRLFATDIILLGNLNKDNIYGIPQFFTALPSTTANVPTIATVQESVLENEDEEEGDNELLDGQKEENGILLETGMDWGRNGSDETPQFKSGLFMDLACTYIDTRLKACINVERLSEYGVSNDMAFKTQYSKGGGLKDGEFTTDGFINKLELDDMENRAMFATMNHIGFIPQAYQDSIGAYDTQIEDSNTNYLVPKFKYIYPVDFDGRLKTSMEWYENGFKQAMRDIPDESYITFRLGAEENTDNEKNSEGRIRHFYISKGSYSDYRAPLYNNSFYFYFGIKKGSTAIDKFNQTYYAACVSDEKVPFTLDIDTNGKSYCPTMYHQDNYANSYGWIRISSDDIRIPFSYVLYDSVGIEVVSESGMTMTDFVIGGEIDTNDNEKVTHNKEGGFNDYRVYPQIDREQPVDNIYGRYGLTNQEYTLEITDSEGKRITQRIKLSVPKINASFQTRNLGAKFTSINETRIDYICNDENMFYGVISFDSFAIDGYDCTITSFDCISTSPSAYIFRVVGKSEDVGPNDIEAYLYLSLLDNGAKVGECLCDKGNGVPNNNAMFINNTNKNYYCRLQEGKAEIFVYQPKTFNIELIQSCDGVLLQDNSMSTMVTIDNGENFITELNDMPLRFMLGVLNDNENAIQARESNFYRNKASEDTLDGGLLGWYGLHEPDTYSFPNVDSPVWDEMIKNDLSNMSEDEKTKQILAYELNCMFSLCEAGYFTSDSSKTFRYRAYGGVSPILYRSVAPKYDDMEKIGTQYVLNDKWQVTSNDTTPNIVGVNYSGATTDKRAFSEYSEPDLTKMLPYFNSLIFKSNKKLVGNYFAAFTHNGGYETNKKLKKGLNVLRQPSYTSVSPINGNDLKEIGRDRIGPITNFKYVYDTGQQMLPDDKKRTVQPYIRAMFVDRRLDYDFTIIAPLTSSNFNLYDPDSEDPDNEKENEKNEILRGARLSGFTYNGIEMVYDDDYNIIGPDLEYNINGFTIEYNDMSNIKINKTKPKKRYYSATMGNTSIVNDFWSDFNNTDIGSTNIETPGIYKFKYPRTKQRFSMSPDFNKENVSNRTVYPTRRFIDVCKLPPASNYTLSIESCSYDISAVATEDGIVCEAMPGERFEFVFNPSSPIEVISPNSESNDYANIIYKANGKENGYMRFKLDDFKLRFKFTQYSPEKFSSYTKTPRLIRVLDEDIYDSYDIDGIGLIKTSNTEREFDNNFGDGYTLGNAIEKLTLEKYEIYRRTLFSPIKVNVILPSGIGLKKDFKTKCGKNISAPNDNFFIDKNNNNTWLESSDSRFSEITFNTSNISNRELREKNVKAVAVLIDREYWCNDNDYLTKHIRTIEFSDVYDARDILIKILTKDNDENLYSYVTKKTINSSTNSVEVPGIDVNTDTDSDGNTTVTTTPTTSTVETEDNTILFQQTLTFEMYVSTSKSQKPYNKQCAAFDDYDMMGFTFRFSDGKEVYDVTQVVAERIDNEDHYLLRFTVKWNSDMGILVDWRNPCKCTIFAKTASNFVYKLDKFTIHLKSQQPSNGKNGMVDGEMYLTDAEIITS